MTAKGAGGGGAQAGRISRRRDNRPRLVGCGCGQRANGPCFAPEEEVKSGCKRKMIKCQTLLVGGGRIEGGKNRSGKLVKIGGVGGLD